MEKAELPGASGSVFWQHQQQHKPVQDGGTGGLVAGCWWMLRCTGAWDTHQKVRKGCRLAYLLLSEPPKAPWLPQADCAGSQALSASRLCTGQRFVPQ